MRPAAGLADGPGEGVIPEPPPSVPRRLAGLVRAMRPHQWSKNLVCFAGLIFSGQLFRAGPLAAALVAFASFCLASSACYLINDACDREADRRHPEKRHRPLASGLVPVGWALAAAGGLLGLAVAAARALPPPCLPVLVIYLVMTVIYSLALKHRVLLDVLTIAFGFVLRVLFGVFAVEVLPTAWVLLCMFFLALFLGFAKRRSELNQVLQARAGDEAEPAQRPVLERYRIDQLDILLAMTATMAVCFYALYTVTGRPDHDLLVVTVPVVFYGIARYMTQVMRFNLGDSPERHLLRDPVSLLIAVLWAVLCVAILYTDYQPLGHVDPPARPGPSGATI